MKVYTALESDRYQVQLEFPVQVHSFQTVIKFFVTVVVLLVVGGDRPFPASMKIPISKYSTRPINVFHFRLK